MKTERGRLHCPAGLSTLLNRSIRVDGQTEKMRESLMTEGYLAIKRTSCHLWGHGWTLRNSANWSKLDKERLFSLHMLTYMWNLEKPDSQTRRAEWWLPCAGGAGNGELLIKRYPFPFTRWVSSGDLTYTTGAAASNSVSCTWKLLSE